MSLGQPDLYIGGQLMQTATGDPQPALAGLRIAWGNDSRLELDPAATLSGQLLIRGSMPSFLDVGAPVGVVDPVTGRCLFAGNLAPLTAVPDDSVRDAMRVSFTAASPLAELVKHKVIDFDWPLGDSAITRRARLAGAMPRGWTLGGDDGWTWIAQGRQCHQSKEWLTLAERYVRSYNQRLHDTSYYVPGSGLKKRITVTAERGKTFNATGPSPGARGVWGPSQYALGSTGTSFLPTSTIRRSIDWEKTPGDVVTDVQLSTWGGATAEPESTEFEFWMDVYVNNHALQDAYGFRQIKVETSMSVNNTAAAERAVVDIVNYWLDTATAWRPTGLQIPDSRQLDTAPLLNLIAVDTRHMAIVYVPQATGLPGRIRSFVMSGAATWTGKKWTTDLTLGRTL